MDKITSDIENGKTALGIELGSTRIKAALTDGSGKTLATGVYSWENRYDGGFWTYGLDEVRNGIRGCYKALKDDVRGKYGVTLSTAGAIGVSAMMHGYLAFDKADRLLTPFRTWRNNNAEEAAKKLTELFGYPVPARWSIAHLYQAVLNGEEHIGKIAYLTTLAGYVHYALTGRRVLGIGDASGMFPIDTAAKGYDAGMLAAFDAVLATNKLPYRLDGILPRILLAGQSAGTLTEAGAELIDPDGDLRAGIPLCPPEGDAGTGMVSTNCVKEKTCNVSAGTSIFSMTVLERPLSGVHPEIDLVTTPSGELAAMAHCNNCTSDINAWAGLFAEFAALAGADIDKNELFYRLFNKSLDGDPDCGGVLAYNYVSGENITGIDEGRPTLLRTTGSNFNLANLMRAHAYAAIATLKIGMDILTETEGVKIDSVCGHGGIFKTEGVMQSYLASATGVPVTVTEAADNGGAWGMAALASYMLNGGGTALGEYLDKQIFCGAKSKSVPPDPTTAAGFSRYMENFKKGLSAVKEAVRALRKE